jgi:hypothetical protein
MKNTSTCVLLSSLIALSSCCGGGGESMRFEKNYLLLGLNGITSWD